MSKKEIKLHMGFMDENGNLVEIPENIQKHIEAREKFWANKIKDIDSKCGIVLERLALTEKALKLACDKIADILAECEQEKLLNSYGMDRNADIAEDYKEKIADLEAKLAESEKEIASLEVCLLENKNNMKEMQGFKIGEDEYDLTDEDARSDLRDYIQEFEKVSKRVYEQKEYAEKILRMSTSEEHQEILQLKQQLAEKDQAIECLQEINQSLGQTCNNDAKEIDRLREKENLLNLIVDGYYTPTNTVKRQIREQNQTAIEKLEKVRTFITVNNEPTRKMTAITRFINQQINDLRSE